MEKIKAIIIFEYVSRVRRLSFLLTTIFSPLLSLLYLAIPIAFTVVGLSERQITILDQSGAPGLYEAIKKKAGEAPAGAKYSFSQVVVPPEQDIDQFRLRFNAVIENDSAKAYLIIRQGILNGVSPEYYASGVSDFFLANLSANISSAVTEQKLVRAGLDPEGYLKPLTMKTIRVSSKGEAQESAANLATSFIIFMFTFLGILGHGSQVMASIIEEKQTRIIEVMVSSAKPFEMMMGKLIGIGLVALTQYLIWVIVAVPILFINQAVLATQGITLNLIPISSLIYFVIYFVLGYLLYASLSIVGGAMVTDTETSNIVTRFLFVLTALPFMTMVGVIRDPDGIMALTLSFIPFFTTGTMVMRLAIASPPLWQILLSMLLLVATILGTVWVAAKVYRVGILIYGKKPNLPELLRWLRYT